MTWCFFIELPLATWSLVKLKKTVQRHHNAHRHYAMANTMLQKLEDRRSAQALGHDLAVAQAGIARIQFQWQQYESAEETMRPVLAIREQNAQKFPEELSHQAGLADCQNLLGIICLMSGKRDEAERLFRTALRSVQEMPKPWQQQPDLLSLRASSAGNLGSVCFAEQGDPAKARRQFEEAYWAASLRATIAA